MFSPAFFFRGGEPPTFVAASYSRSTGAATPAQPTGWAADDIMILWQHCTNTSVGTDPTLPSGYTSLLTQTLSSTSRSRISWRRAVAGDAAPTLTDDSNLSNYNTALLTAIRGCTTSGSPVDTSNSSIPADSTSVSMPTVTTTVGNTLIFMVESSGGPNVTHRTVSGWANADLTGLTEQNDNTADYFNVATATGVKVAAGAVSATAATLTVSGTQGLITLALKGP